MRKNQYECPNGHKIITVQSVEGTTPFLIKCRECNSMAMSKFGMIDQSLRATYEWYLPNVNDVPDNQKDHVRMGGLLLKKLNS